MNVGAKVSGRTIIASNRLPVQARVEGGRLRLARSAGGLVTGLEAVHERGESLWVGALGLSSTSSVPLEATDLRRLRDEGLRAVDIPDDLYEAYYTGFSNSSICAIPTSSLSWSVATRSVIKGNTQLAERPASASNPSATVEY